LATVLITGTSVGIGYESALAFARAGHQVAATMRNPERAPRLAEQAARDKCPSPSPLWMSTAMHRLRRASRPS
jgi:NAD(P)-dependent dehydrogenase (short-subunit alcohol dehydrogenase family)